MRICSGAGCLRAVPDDVRYCDECRPHSKADDIRSHTSGKGYTESLDKLRKSLRWQQLRARVLRAHPMCRRCKRRLAEIVDHIIPAEVAVRQAQDSGKYQSRWAGYFLRSNLQGLCRSCHAEKTAEDKAHIGSWPDVVAREPARRQWSF